MSEEKTESGAETSGAQGDEESLVPLHVNDWFLQQLIELAEMGVEQGITLTVGSAIIHGKLIGGRIYFEELSGLIAEATVHGEDSLKTTLRDLFQSHADLYPKTGEERPPFGTSMPNYVHLREARCYSTDGTKLPSNGGLWRGKVSAVDGFMLGDMKAG